MADKQKAPVRVPDDIRDLIMGICKTYRETPIAREHIRARLETLLETEWIDPQQTLAELLEMVNETHQDMKDLLETTDRIETTLGKKK